MLADVVQANKNLENLAGCLAKPLWQKKKSISFVSDETIEKSDFTTSTKP